MKQNDGLGASVGRWILDHKILSTLAALLLLGSAFPGLGKLYFNSQYRYFFGEKNPQLETFDKLQRVYAKEDSIVIAIVPKSGNVFTKETLKGVEVLTERAWKTPFSTRVDSITNFQHTEAEGDDLTVRKLVEDADALTPAEIVKVKEVALAEPILNGRLVTDQSDIIAINILTNIPGKDPSEVTDTAAFVTKMVDDWKNEFPNHQTYLTGVLMLNNAFVTAGQKDMAQLTPLMYFIIFIIMAVLLRSVSSIFATLAIILFSVLTAMGFAGWANIPLSPPSAIAPTVVLTMAIADSVHFLTSMFGYMREGKEKREAIIESMRINFMPIIITSVTTMIGFLSLNASDSPPYQDLGNISAVGVGAALIYTVFLLPVLMSILPTKVKKEAKQKSNFYHHIADFVIKYKAWLVPILIIASFVIASFIPRLRINDRFIEYFHPSIQFRSDSDFVQTKLTGVYVFEFDVPSAGQQGITDPVYLQKLEDFSQWIRQQPGVKHVWTFTDVMKRINKSMHGDNEDYYRIPDNKELASQYLLLYEMSLPFGLDINNQVDIDKSSTRLVVTISNLSTQRILELTAQIEDWMKKNGPKYMQTEGSGPTIMFSHITERNVRSMIKGTGIAFFLITIMMIISLRSLKYGLISLIPNLFPAMIAFGLWSIWKGEVGFAISVAASVTLGIIVDDTVHFLSKYVRQIREGTGTATDAVRYSFNTVGSAITVTSVILIIGFSILSFSTFKLNGTLGVLSALTIAVALITDFFLLPAILLYIDKEKTK